MAPAAADSLKTSLFVPLNNGQVAGLVRFSGIDQPAALHQAIAEWQAQQSTLKVVDIDTRTPSPGFNSRETQRASTGLAMAFALAFWCWWRLYRNRTGRGISECL